MAGIEVIINTALLSRMKKAMTDALIQTADEILARERADAVMPMDTGRMQNIQTYVDGGAAANGMVRIITEAPQAARLYFNPQYHFRRGRNQNARGEWWEPWISGNRKNEAASLFAAILAQTLKEVL